MATLVTVYNSTSFFELDFDLNEVHDWWVKWDTLYVIHNEGEEPEKYEADISAENNHEMTKRPDRYFVDDVEIQK